MLIKKPTDIPSSEITDRTVYENRRAFIRGALTLGTVAATATLYRQLATPPRESTPQGPGADRIAASGLADEPLTPFDDITNYNNYYEFSTAKGEVARAAREFVTRPWTVAVDGLVHKPRSFDLDDLARLAPAEDRVYRLRCVEGWSMVIPWLGFPLASLLNAVEPASTARYVEFTTLYDPDRMPNQETSILDWPYVEGLRIDEALHPLTILATGLYGEPLLPQNGAPLRLVVPWKYGFKSIKSIVRIRLTAGKPQTTWNIAAPREYGFYSNVNPEVDHPRWSQARERRIGEFSLRDTLPFNGYAEEVAGLYAGMDLRVNF